MLSQNYLRRIVMKFYSNALNETIKKISKMKRGQNPVTDMMNIDAKIGGVNITITNLEFSACFIIDAQTEITGQTTVMTSQISDLAKGMGNGLVFEKVEQNIMLNDVDTGMKGYIGEIPWENLAERITVPDQFTADKSFTIPENELKEILGITLDACGSDIYAGIQFEKEADSNVLTLVSTDSKRLIIGKQTVPYSDLVVKGILPVSTCEFLYKILDKKSSKLVVLCFGPKLVCIAGAGAYIESRYMDIRFPDYRRVVTKDFNWTFIVDRKILLDTCKRILPSCKKNSYMLRFAKSEGGNLVLSCLGEQAVSMGIPMLGCSTEFKPFALNISYLMDILKSSPADTLTFHGTTPTSPIEIHPIVGDRFNYIQMPMTM